MERLKSFFLFIFPNLQKLKAGRYFLSAYISATFVMPLAVLFNTPADGVGSKQKTFYSRCVYMNTIYYNLLLREETLCLMFSTEVVCCNYGSLEIPYSV